MAGRHHRQDQPGAAGTRRRPRLIVAIVAVLVLTALGVLLLPDHFGTSSSSNSSSKSGCTTPVPVKVEAAPAIAPALRTVATTWNASGPATELCAHATVTAVASATAATALSAEKATLPDLWIPDSTLWLDQVASATQGLDVAARSVWRRDPIATTPLIVAAGPARAAAVTQAAATGWPGLLGDSTAVSMVDPNTSTEGLRALLATRAALDAGATTPSRTLVSTLLTSARSVQPSVATGLAQLTARPSIAKAVPATEQELWSATQAAGTDGEITAVYPKGATASLDFPVAQFSVPGQNPAQRDAADAFAATLYLAPAQQALRAVGLRDAAGDALDPATSPSTGATVPIGTQAIKAIAAPTVDDVSDALRLWTAAGRSNRALAVIDLSGSMSETVGGEQTKIQFAAEAEKVAVDFLPDTSSFGLWGFSVRRTATTDWTELVPVGPLGAQLADGTRRKELLAAAAQLPTLTNGDTGLYSTVLDAFESMRSTYDPKAVNSVVVLTDGSNTVTTGVDLPTLLAQLKRETTSARPLPIITIAIGENADVDTLRQISQATGGRTYTVTNPADIRGAFLDAVIRAS